MSPVRFVEPATIEQACEWLAEDPFGAKAVAGGTAMVLMMRQGLLMPDSLLSIRNLTELHGIERSDDVVQIGATTTLAEVAASPVIRSAFPSLARACALVGNPRIRNVATLGGNVAEADYASDPPATLASLGATVRLVGPSGRRTLVVSDVITGFYETSLHDGELITHIDVPLPRCPRGAVYLKYRSRSSEDRACVGVAARVDFSGDGVSDLDVVVAAVASTLQRVPHALEAAIGKVLDAETIEEIAGSYAETIDPMEDGRGSAWYRRKMIRVFVRRALEQARDQHRSAQGGTE